MEADANTLLRTMDIRIEQEFLSLRTEMANLRFNCQMQALEIPPEGLAERDLEDRSSSIAHIREYLNSADTVISNTSEYYWSVSNGSRIDNMSVLGLDDELRRRINDWIPEEVDDGAWLNMPL
jgi:hypothetical protein